MKIYYCLLLMFITVTLGCGSNSYNKSFDPTPAYGYLVFNAMPVGGATVFFEPLDPSQKRKFASFTGPDGRFSPSSFTKGDGALPGTYKLVIFPCQELDNLESFFESRDAARNASELAEKNIPKLFRQADTTPLRVTIEDGKPDLGTFDLSKQY